MPDRSAPRSTARLRHSSAVFRHHRHRGGRGRWATNGRSGDADRARLSGCAGGTCRKGFGEFRFTATFGRSCAPKETLQRIVVRAQRTEISAGCGKVSAQTVARKMRNDSTGERNSLQAPIGWTYTNAAIERVDLLERQASIEALIEQVIVGSVIDRVTPRADCDEFDGKKCGAKRVWFALVPESKATLDAIDQLLNGRFGLRAHYANDSCAGAQSTALVCTAIADALVSDHIRFDDACSLVDRHDLRDCARVSLLGKSAKVWFDSETDTRGVVEEDATVTCDRWAESRRSKRSDLADLLALAHSRWRLTEHQIEAKLIKGATAPLPRFLDVKGAYICADGREYVPINKRNRAEQVHLLGWT